MAIEKGYQILRVYKVWHFNNIAQYDKVKKTGRLITEYVNTFLKIKQEAMQWLAKMV
jgi:hypothetical protein